MTQSCTDGDHKIMKVDKVTNNQWPSLTARIYYYPAIHHDMFMALEGWTSLYRLLGNASRSGAYHIYAKSVP